MAINAKDVIATLPESRQEKIRAMAGRIIDREYSSPVESVEFEFTLILEGIPQLTPEIAAAFDEAGCADALLSHRDGIVSMDFIRAAPTRGSAIVSAILDVERANVGAQVRVKPDMSGLDASQGHLARAINSVQEAKWEIAGFPELDSERLPVANLLHPSPGSRSIPA